MKNMILSIATVLLALSVQTSFANVKPVPNQASLLAHQVMQVNYGGNDFNQVNYGNGDFGQ